MTFARPPESHNGVRMRQRKYHPNPTILKSECSDSKSPIPCPQPPSLKSSPVQNGVKESGLDRASSLYCKCLCALP